MKKTLLTVVVCLIATLTFAQAPASFNFQAVARDASGDVIKNQNVSFRISILQTSSTGTSVYQETHNATTNQYGLVNLSIGAGTPTTGTFASISWGTNKYFLKVDMDASGGSSFTEMGVQQLISVPYALNAEKANSVTNSDNDTTNEIQTLSKTGNNVSLTKGGGSFSVADNDNSTSNEIQKISIVGSNLSLDKTGGTVPINSLNHWSKSGTQVNYTNGNVGIGTTSPEYKLHVTGSGDTSTAYFFNGSSGGSAVKGASRNGPTAGYLGIQSSNNFDNNPLIKFPGGSGREVGVLGVSTGSSATDNIGIMGLTNGGFPGYFKNTGSSNQVSIATNSYGLSVDTGSLRVEGEINRNATGTANLVPIAYGSINPSGTINTGKTTNYTVKKTATGKYEITFTGGYSYHFGSSVVALSLGASTTGFIAYNSASGKLLVETRNTAGAFADAYFTFVIYTP